MEKTTFTHKYTELSNETIAKRVNEMLSIRETIDTTNAVVKFSQGNRKTGTLIPSVSLIPIADCRNCKNCKNGCYAVKHMCIYPSVKNQVANNSAIAHKDITKYFEQILEFVRFRVFFRYHIQGDILSREYFAYMVRIAELVPSCKFLAFTKCFDIVNDFIKDNGELPKNLNIIFSDWKGMKMDNPYNLPVSSPIWEDGTKGDNCTEKTYLCNGFCEECAKSNTKCWNAQKGDTILFEAH